LLVGHVRQRTADQKGGVRGCPIALRRFRVTCERIVSHETVLLPGYWGRNTLR
jgi:hypothetical protein